MQMKENYRKDKEESRFKTFWETIFFVMYKMVIYSNVRHSGPNGEFKTITETKL